MPKNLAEYFRVMREISKSGDDYVAKVETNSVLKQFEDFVFDFYPWSRLLLTCVNKYATEFNIIPGGIPPIDKIKTPEYKAFISVCNKEEIDKLIHNPSEIISFIKSKMISGGKSKKIKTSKKTRKTKKTKKSKKTRKTKKSKKII